MRELDFVTAAIRLLLALGISGPAWRDAVDAMGDIRAALCVLATDASRHHPATPVRKPGRHSAPSSAATKRASPTSWAASWGCRSGAMPSEQRRPRECPGDAGAQASAPLGLTFAVIGIPACPDPKCRRTGR